LISIKTFPARSRRPCRYKPDFDYKIKEAPARFSKNPAGAKKVNPSVFGK